MPASFDVDVISSLKIEGPTGTTKVQVPYRLCMRKYKRTVHTYQVAKSAVEYVRKLSLM